MFLMDYTFFIATFVPSTWGLSQGDWQPAQHRPSGSTGNVDGTRGFHGFARWVKGRRGWRFSHLSPADVFFFLHLFPKSCFWGFLFFKHFEAELWTLTLWFTLDFGETPPPKKNNPFDALGKTHGFHWFFLHQKMGQKQTASFQAPLT